MNSTENGDVDRKAKVIEMVRVMWLDYSGIRRCKAVPQSLLSNNVKMTKAGMILTPWNALTSGTVESPTGEVSLLPFSKYKTVPPPTATQLPWHKTHSVILAEMYDEGRPWTHCPHAALERAIALLRQHHLAVRAGFELEFYLFTAESVRRGEPEAPGKIGSYASFDQLDAQAGVLDEMMATLKEMEIKVLMTHAESGWGQYELVLDHKPVGEAVRDLILAREAVRAVAGRHGLHATFVPRYAGGAGSGAHVHMSVDGEFGTRDEAYGVRVGMSKTGQHFMAGVVAGLPWLSVLLNGTEMSYERTQPGLWVGAYQAWSVNNKETPVRIAQDRSNFEVKPLDGVSNVYLAMAGLLLAGLLGVREGMELGPPSQIDPHLVAEDKRPPRLPTGLAQAVQTFEMTARSGKLDEVFAKEMVHDFLRVKQTEVEYVWEHGAEELNEMLLRLH